MGLFFFWLEALVMSSKHVPERVVKKQKTAASIAESDAAARTALKAKEDKTDVRSINVHKSMLRNTIKCNVLRSLLDVKQRKEVTFTLLQNQKLLLLQESRVFW